MASNLLRKREVSPFELVSALLERIDLYGRDLNAYITVCTESALQQAQECEREIATGRHKGSLHGIPIAVKDLINTKGVCTTYGSRIFESNVPSQDADVIQSLRGAGAIVVGKTNLHEFAFGGTTINPHFGTTRNPWDLQRISGGSSGGSAVAVSATLCLGALGSDTGGSIRGPASYCGVVGFKPTYGLVSCRGVFPLAWSLDHVGPIAKDVRDAALILDALVGRAPSRPDALQLADNFSRAIDDGVADLRIGVVDPFSLAHWKIEGEVLKIFEEAVKVFESEGARVTEVQMPSWQVVNGVFNRIVCSEAYAIHEPILRRQSEDYGEDVRWLLQLGALYTAAEYVRAQRERTRIIVHVLALLEDLDLIMIPTMPIPAPSIEEAPALAQRTYQGQNTVAPRLTPLFNLMGLPTISVPAGFTSDGMPVGIQLAGHAFHDTLVLRAARGLERALSLQLRPPMVPKLL